MGPSVSWKSWFFFVLLHFASLACTQARPIVMPRSSRKLVATNMDMEMQAPLTSVSSNLGKAGSGSIGYPVHSHVEPSDIPVVFSPVPSPSQANGLEDLPEKSTPILPTDSSSSGSKVLDQGQNSKSSLEGVAASITSISVPPPPLPPLESSLSRYVPSRSSRRPYRPSKKKKKEKSLKSLLIALIVILVLALILLALWCCISERAKRLRQQVLGTR